MSSMFSIIMYNVHFYFPNFNMITLNMNSKLVKENFGSKGDHFK